MFHHFHLQSTISFEMLGPNVGDNSILLQYPIGIEEISTFTTLKGKDHTATSKIVDNETKLQIINQLNGIKTHARTNLAKFLPISLVFHINKLKIKTIKINHKIIKDAFLEKFHISHKILSIFIKVQYTKSFEKIFHAKIAKGIHIKFSKFSIQ